MKARTLCNPLSRRQQCSRSRLRIIGRVHASASIGFEIECHRRGNLSPQFNVKCPYVDNDLSVGVAETAARLGRWRATSVCFDSRSNRDKLCRPIGFIRFISETQRYLETPSNSASILTPFAMPDARFPTVSTLTDRVSAPCLCF